MQMTVEKRDNGTVHIEGYVNAIERESRTLRDTNGMPFNEMIMEGTFERAIDNAEKIDLMVDHERVIGDTNTNLELHEDAIGLRASLDTDDPDVVEHADSLRGWSFGFRDAVATLEQRSDKPCLRRITDLILDEVSLIVNKIPAYAGTIAECRDDKCTVKEQRAYVVNEVQVVDTVRQSIDTTYGDVSTTIDHVESSHTYISEPLTDIDYSPFEDRLNALKN